MTEFAGCHNDREQDTMTQMTAMFMNVKGKSLRYTDLTADNGLPAEARG